MKKHGFTLIEVAISLGLVSLVALAIIGVFSHLMLASSKTADQAAAEVLAQSIMDESLRIGLEHWNGKELSTRVQTADSEVATEFLYRVDGNQISGTEHTFGSMYEVTVLVSWSGSLEKTQRRRQGNLWLERTRLSYVEQQKVP